MVWIEVEHLGSCAQTEAETLNDRRALEPATARCARHYVPVPDGNADMHCVPLGDTGRRCPPPGLALVKRVLPASERHAEGITPRVAGTEVDGRALADDGATAS